MKRGERGKDRKPRLRKMTDKRKASYYRKIVYFQCSLCHERWNIFQLEGNMIEHILDKHRALLDEDDKVSLLRKLSGSTYLTEEDCRRYGVDFQRFKRFKGGEG